MGHLDHLSDLYLLDDDWTEEQKIVCNQIRRFIDNEVLPIMESYQEKKEFPKEVIPGLSKLGILEALLSGDLDSITYGLVMREIERAGSTLRSFVSVQSGLVMFPLMEFGSEEQKNTWLPGLSTFDKIGCFGLTEPDYGSNPSGMKTNAKKIGNEYRINGTKAWITNGTMADVAIIWARLEDKIRGFVVETDRKGFEARAMTGKWSFAASDTGQLFMDDVIVPESALLPGATSIGSALKCLNSARYGIAWGVIGAARACLEEAIDYLSNRPQFDGKSLTSHQLVQSKLAWIATELTGMELIGKRLGELKDSGRLKHHHVSLAKMNNCRKALEIARTCRELLGANGIHNAYISGRYMIDLETVVTYEGTEHIHSLVLGQFLTGVKAFV